MNKKIATRWVKALRSGKYKQGTDYLCKTEDGHTKHCCLGVLTDMYQQECKRNKKKALSVKIISGSHPSYTVFTYNKEDKVLPVAVKKWAGMKNRSGRIETENECLAFMNDEGDSFKKIANFIEKNYDKL